MTLHVNSTRGTYAPTALRDWLWAEAIAMGWDPELRGNRGYTSSVNLPELMRELAREAAAQPQFSHLVNICLELSKRDDLYWLKASRKYPFTPYRGRGFYPRRVVCPHVYEVCDAEGNVLKYLAHVWLGKKAARKTIGRSFKTLPQALSFRDRVQIALQQGDDPFQVPLLEEPFGT